MNKDSLLPLWTRYESAELDLTVHPDDHMRNTARSLDDYLSVGRSGIEVAFAALSLAPTSSVTSMLDFGCGYGRVARHFRAFLPSASIFFADIKGAEFCAEQFGGEAIVPTNDFDELDLPTDIDLIWVGSVFTHIELPRMQQLFDALAGSLAPNGTLAATFHGREVVRRVKEGSTPGMEDWPPLVDAYQQSGFSWMPYPGDLGARRWGVSLIKPEVAMSLSDAKEETRCVAYMPQAWTSFQDVGVWTRGT